MTAQPAKTILVTGGTGFLGSHVVHNLVTSGHRVLVLKRPSSNLDRLSPILHALSVYDLEEVDLSVPFKEYGKVDAVIHTATCYGRNGETEVELSRTNTSFPLHLLEVATSYNTNTFINTDTVLHKYLNAYALSKNHFVEWGKLFANRNRIRFVNIRLEHMYGPYDEVTKFTTRVMKDCLANVPEIKLTPGDQMRDFVYIDDVIAGYKVLLEKTESQRGMFQEYDLGSGKPVSIRLFVETVHKLSGSSTHLNFGALPYRNGEIMYSAANTEKLESLGWRCQTSLVDGIQKTMRLDKNLQK